jgi:hypothetical protein
VPKEGEEALITAMKEMWVGYLVYFNLARMTDGGLESRNSSPRGLLGSLLPGPLQMPTFRGSRVCWTIPKGPSFPVGKRICQRDTLPLRSFVELRSMTRS